MKPTCNAGYFYCPYIPLQDSPKFKPDRWGGWGLPSFPRTTPKEPVKFDRISIPLVRRIYPRLIANKITSVQPLLGPTGLVYYLRFRYSSTKLNYGGVVSGETSCTETFPADTLKAIGTKIS